jgi:hypothetical protein
MKMFIFGVLAAFGVAYLVGVMHLRAQARKQQQREIEDLLHRIQKDTPIADTRVPILFRPRNSWLSKETPRVH